MNGSNIINAVIPIIAVVIGCLLTLKTIRWTEKRKEKKLDQERMQQLYIMFYKCLNANIRLEILYLQNNLYFNYHKSLGNINPIASKTYEQGVYHQKQVNEILLKIHKEATNIDICTIRYNIRFGPDDKFNELSNKIASWKRFDCNDYFIDVYDSTQLYDRLQNGFALIDKAVYKDLAGRVKELIKHIENKLL